MTSLPPQITTFLLSMLPFSELRGALPFAVFKFKMEIYEAFIWSVLGNIFITLILLLFLNKTQQLLTRHSSFFKKFFNHLFKKTFLRHKKKFKLIQDLALVLIVAVPLPFTGAWTGSLAAYVFRVPIKKAFPLIALGVIIAGIIVATLTQAGQAWWVTM